LKCAFVGIREQPVYRRGAFVEGLKSIGYDVRIGTPDRYDAETVYVSWNRYSSGHDICSRAEAAGGIALIAENAYVGINGSSPHDSECRDSYALAPSYHNDSRYVRDGGPERWAALGIELKPWRGRGDHILICANRSFGTPGRVMPADWAGQAERCLRTLTKREIRTRPHPGNAPPRKPLVEDLAGAWCVVQWHSSAGVHALIAGIPVICCAPAWICKGAAGSELSQIESPPMPERLPAMERLAWGQWTVAEIASGEAFRAVLGCR
jgi:hypothetical protein